MEIRIGNQTYEIDEGFDWERGVYEPLVIHWIDPEHPDIVWSYRECGQTWLGHQSREMIHFLFDVVLEYEMERCAPNV